MAAAGAQRTFTVKVHVDPSGTLEYTVSSDGVQLVDHGTWPDAAVLLVDPFDEKREDVDAQRRLS
jgi:hypothetical protein